MKFTTIRPDGADSTRTSTTTLGNMTASMNSENALQIQEKLDDPEGENQCCSIRNYPKGVFFMLGNEFCERFSFYGMRAILVLYLITIHQFSDTDAKLIFHLFVSICYFAPLIGSFVADGWLGRYKVIAIGSIIYCGGHTLLTCGSIPYLDDTLAKVLDFTGLFTIAFATGGIKPCVSAFAADQFPDTMVKERTQFFSFFYFAINAGALISKVITPILRGRVHCLGADTCFPLAFGVPAVLMFVATIFLFAGSRFYVYRPAAGENIVAKVFHCIFCAIRNRVREGRHSKHQHWMDAAGSHYDQGMINDVRSLLDVVVLFIPVVFFWALFDQQGSTWVLQANRMNGRMGDLTILPDQMSVCNPLLIIILVPIFEYLIYPFLTKYNILTSSLRRMGWGGVLAALSFVIAGFLQLAVNKTLVMIPNEGERRIFLQNAASCGLGIEFDQPLTLLTSSFKAMDVDRSTLSIANASECAMAMKGPIEITTGSNRIGQLITFFNSESGVYQTSRKIKLQKAMGGKHLLYVFADAYLAEANSSMLLVRHKDEIEQSIYITNGTFALVQLQPALLGSSDYTLSVDICRSSADCKEHELASFEAEMGRVDTIAISMDSTGKFKATTRNKLIQANSVSLMWQIPQYLVITVGEILFSITGLEFSYSQAPPKMKSVVQAFWLMTVAFGNVIDMIISGSHMVEDAAIEFFVYAGLMALVMVIFVLLAKNYKYKTFTHDQ